MTNTTALDKVEAALRFVRKKVVSNPETIRHFMQTGEKALEHNMRFLQYQVDEALSLIPQIREGLEAKAPKRELVSLKADDVEWVVNDIAELGIKIGQQFFFLYKGTSLQYDGLRDEDDEGNRQPMRWRHVYKREFGECCHPVEQLKLAGKTTLDDFPNAYGWADDWQDMPTNQIED